MKIMIDTNVILDFLLDRDGFADDAEQILLMSMKKQIIGCVMTSAVTDIFYIAGKRMEEPHLLYLLMEDLMEDVLLIGIQPGDIMAAIDQKELDFEDCLMAVCAERVDCDYIVTRNTGDFKNSAIPAVTPKEFFGKFN